jgi:DNA-binding beta-propeller fold protein YncE
MLFAAAVSVPARSLVFPPYLHSYGIRKATPKHLFVFFGPRTFFDNPQGLATAKMISRDNPSVESDDDEVVVYGVNTGRNEIIYNTSMWTLALFGSKGSGRGQFLNPEGIACDTRGNVYVADRGNNRIVHLFNPKKEVSWVRIFSGGKGVTLNSPSRVALDEQGRIYVTDTGNRRIVVLDSAGRVSHVIPGNEDKFKFSQELSALAVADGSSRWSYFRMERLIFCADSLGRRIWKMSFDGKVIKTVILPDGYRAAYAAVDYYHNLWITDPAKSCIIKYDHNLELLDIFGSYGKADNQFLNPQGIAIWKRYGQVFVAEKTGAQYYWVGTYPEKISISQGKKPGSWVLSTRLPEYSFISLFRASGADTIFYMKKRFVPPGMRETGFSAGTGFSGQKIIVRAEPTYSSYTYFYKDTVITPVW